MPSKKGKGGPKGKGTAPKGKGKQAAMSPALPASSSSEDELDADQWEVLGQISGMEWAQGMVPRAFPVGRSGAGRRDPAGHWSFTGEVLECLTFLHSQPPAWPLQVASHLSQPPSQSLQRVSQQTEALGPRVVAAT